MGLPISKLDPNLNCSRVLKVYNRGSRAGALSATNDLKGRRHNWEESKEDDAERRD